MHSYCNWNAALVRPKMRVKRWILSSHLKVLLEVDCFISGGLEVAVHVGSRKGKGLCAIYPS